MTDKTKKVFKAQKSSVYSQNPEAFSRTVFSAVLIFPTVMMALISFTDPKAGPAFFIFAALISLSIISLWVWSFHQLLTTNIVKSVTIDWSKKMVTVRWSRSFLPFENHRIHFSELAFTYGSETTTGFGPAFSSTMVVYGPDSSTSSSQSHKLLIIKDVPKNKSFRVFADQRNWYGRPFRGLVDELMKLRVEN